MTYTRLSFLLFLGVLLIPLDEEEHSVSSVLSTQDAVSAARVAFNDMGQFCQRNSDVCGSMATFTNTVQLKARKGAHMLHSYLDKAVSSNDRQPNNEFQRSSEPKQSIEAILAYYSHE